MSTPMYDVPDHLLVGVTADGRGPAFGDEIDHWQCWCGDPTCKKYENDRDRNT